MRRLLWGCAAVVVCAVASGARTAAAQGATTCDSPCKVMHLPLVGPRGAVCDSPCKLQHLPLVYQSDQPVPNSNPLEELQGRINRMAPGSSPRVTFGRGADSTVHTVNFRLPPFERDVAVSVQSMNNVMPLYPPLLRIAQMSGKVVASFVVDTLGRVETASFEVQRATEPQFAVAVREAMANLRFTPAVDRSGRKAPQLVRESVEFRLLAGGMTQVTARSDGCTLANQANFADVPACSPPPVAGLPGVPISWGWSLGGENVTGAYARSGNYSPGFVVGAQVQFPLPSRRLALRLEGAYHSIAENDYACLLTIPDRCVKQGDYSHVVTLGFDLVARLNDPQIRWSPYLLGGMGINVAGSPAESPYDFRQTHGVQGGAGFEFRLHRATTFVEARYVGLQPGGLTVWSFGFRY